MTLLRYENPELERHATALGYELYRLDHWWHLTPRYMLTGMGYTVSFLNPAQVSDLLNIFEAERKRLG